MAVGTVSNTNMRPVWVVYNSVVVGLCEEEDITLRVDPTWHDHTYHQTGNWLPEAHFGGARITVSATFSEVLEMDNWEAAFEFGEKQKEESTPETERFSFSRIANDATGAHVGLAASAIAKELRLIPLSSGNAPTTDVQNQIVINKVFSRNAVEVAMSTSSGMALPLEFEALFDPAAAGAAEGEHIAIVGKIVPDAGTWVAA